MHFVCIVEWVKLMLKELDIKLVLLLSTELMRDRSQYKI